MENNKPQSRWGAHIVPTLVVAGGLALGGYFVMKSYEAKGAEAREFLQVADSIAQQLNYDTNHDGILSDIELEAFVSDFGQRLGGFKPAYQQSSNQLVLANPSTREIMGLKEVTARMRKEYEGAF